MPERPPLTLRLATPSDLRFVKHSWFQSYRKGGRAPDVAFPVLQAGLGALIDRLVSEASVFVAAATEVPDEICGWSCRRTGTLHYVYVKQAYRHLGIGRQLCAEIAQIAGPVVWHTFETRAGTQFAQKIGTKFNPFLLFD